MPRGIAVSAVLFLAFCVRGGAAASDLDEFKVKREQVFEFVQKPAVARDGDRVTITFESKAFCDATVAIEDANGPSTPSTSSGVAGSGQGKIIRHLASGVLGPNAPEPFQKNSLKQTVVWDGKDDQGAYVDDKDAVTVRVSLGLRPQLERTLFWSPHKRMSNACILLEATEQGVLVFEGRGVDSVRLYDHAGNYVRTIYPFPADKLAQVAGVERRTFPQDGQELPVKKGFVQGSLLTSGTSCLLGLAYKFGGGYGATVMAHAKGRIALGYDYVNRLTMDGTTGGLKLTGAKIGRRARWAGYGGFGGGEEIIGPSSMAFSPDGRTIYLAGYMWREFYMGGANTLHGVLKLDFESDAEPTVFAGVMDTDKGAGTDNAHFTVPASVACDAQGRVYVADHMNDRVQIFGADGKFLKSIPAKKPAKVLVSPRNGEIWVCSWPVVGVSNSILRDTGFDWDRVRPVLTRFESFDNPKQVSAVPIPVGFSTQGFFLTGAMVNVAVDWWAERPTLWVAARKYDISRIDVAWGGGGAYAHRDADPWMNDGLKLFVEKNDRWELVRDFGSDAKAAVAWVKPPDFSRQRLCVNPKNGMLYVLEDSGFSKSFYRMPEINPATGKVKIAEIPFDAEEICFDLDGRAYLRTDTLVARYDSATWREVPWDYGEERARVGFTSIGGSKRADTISALPTPGVRPVCWNQGGMYVSPRGRLVVSCTSRAEQPDRRTHGEMGPWQSSRAGIVGKAYTPTMFQGRVRWQEIHVWDTHGKVVYEDAIQGMPAINGIGMDHDDNVYVMASSTRVIDGAPYWNEMTGTVVKFRPKEGRVISASGRAPLPLAKDSWPKRPPDIAHGLVGSGWFEGALWAYGGVGWDGFNPSHSGGGCDCWNSRFCLDLFARSFAPEIDHFSIAVLDSSGNLILRVGRYGNVDDGRPLDPNGGPPSARSIGGDEVGLFHACYLGTHTDRRLFIADAGNGRILSVRLDYHATQAVRLRDVPDRGGTGDGTRKAGGP